MLEGSILQQLADAHAARGTRRNFGVYYKNTLVALCHALEDAILESSHPPLVIAAFQRGKWYLQEADRYAQLADRSQQTVILAAPDGGFAEHTTSQREDVALVSLRPEDPVAQEWHLMILSPSYQAMVLCQELAPEDYGPAGPPSDDLERKFYGFWTFSAELVQETIALTLDHLGQYDSALQAQLQDLLTEIAAARPHTPPDDRSAIAAQVVDYLQVSQAGLATHHHSLGDNLVSNELQAFLRLAESIDLADPRNPNAAADVATICDTLGQLLDLPAWQVKRLRLASLLHRIAPLQTAPSDLKAIAEATADCGDCCALVPGAQVLRKMSRLRAIAQIVTHQTERWDGSGQPAQLSGDTIPLESRILGLAADFQQRYIERKRQDPEQPQGDRLEAILADYIEETGLWDPKVMDALTLMIRGLQQGLSLPTITYQTGSGLWLLDDEDYPVLTSTSTAVS